MKEGLYFGSELDHTHRLVGKRLCNFLRLFCSLFNPVCTRPLLTQCQVAAGIPLHGSNLFPSNMPDLKSTVLEYMDAMNKVSEMTVMKRKTFPGRGGGEGTQ
jgi:isopenicillin N synthase-like dioxygenase